ncbi:respiratory nitrate reductase subunit gamma [Virgibacillus profundi]|uniref:Respiratory nitrate reductase subunit gamma n=1 Tax=Virgibacillus profundi TaxID=2024555 RepID=A0A2A2IEC0_9BACI|nr:respiratory nitrate reductase subunit gamma [Virgibacillus profundi]PAV29433.1 respiratory nitrate reductase subunit gamma [Virgibacillus profundi]PXY53602.1 respiratory nitrate reductase subunit gamma [Virgibacillus profundi]
MTNLDIFLWIIFPYISLTIFILGHIYRYNTDQFGWTAKSSQFLEQKRLRFGSTVFHWGIIFVFFGHVGGLLIPKLWFDTIGITDDMYHFGAIWFGGLAGLAVVIGGFFLFLRRVAVKRIVKNSSVSDYVALIMLGIVVLVGFTNTAGYTATGGSFDYRVTIGPWLREILTLRPSEGMVLAMAQAPIGFKLHVSLAFVLFAIWPFTRLVHVFSLPLKYLNRNYVVYRNIKPYHKTKVAEKKEIN